MPDEPDIEVPAAEPSAPTVANVTPPEDAAPEVITPDTHAPDTDAGPDTPAPDTDACPAPDSPTPGSATPDLTAPDTPVSDIPAPDIPAPDIAVPVAIVAAATATAVAATDTAQVATAPAAPTSTYKVRIDAGGRAIELESADTTVTVDNVALIALALWRATDGAVHAPEARNQFGLVASERGPRRSASSTMDYPVDPPQ